MAELGRRDLLMVRTHRASEAALRAYDRYAAVQSLDVVLVCDEREGELDVGSRDKVGFTATDVEGLGLYAHPDYGWRCGDYFHYIGRSARPDYDRYWMIEPDVWIHTSDLDAWFDQFREDDADLLVSWFGRRRNSWSWFVGVAPFYEAVYGCTFPVTRLSGPALDHLLAARRAASADSTRWDAWPNDESFVASELMAAGFKCADLNQDERVLYTRNSFRNAVPQDFERLAASPPDGLIHHPVQDWMAWLERIDKIMAQASRPLTKRGQVARIAGSAGGLRLNPDYADASVISLLIAGDAYQRRPWAAKGKAVDEAADLRSARMIEKRLKGEFLSKPKDRDGVPLHVVEGLKSNTLGTRKAEPDDFVLGEAQRVSRFPARFALPYCWDLEARRLLLTLHVRPQAILAEPFLYVAQRQRARVVATAGLDQLDDLYGKYDPEFAPLFIFSVGRTGSTLLHRLLGCVSPRSVSEPDTLTQLATSKRALKALRPEDQARTLWHSISAFRTAHVDRADDDAPTFKFRSQVNGLASELLTAFPKARSVFMFRDRRDWAKSTFRVFNLSPEDAVGRLLTGVRTLERLRDAGSPIEVVWYEDMVAEPRGAVARLLGREPSAEAEAAMSQVLEADSQAGTKVSRKQGAGKSAEAETRWLAQFEQAWTERRPADVLERLGLQALDGADRRVPA